MTHNYKLIEFYHEHPDLIKDHPIIAIEVEGMAVEYTDEETGQSYPCPAHTIDAEPEFWSVYVRQRQGSVGAKEYFANVFNPLICVADCADKDDVEAFANFLRILLKLPTDDKSSIR